jgi:hypothetical protein
VTGARLRDTLILTGPWGLNRPRSVPSNRLVRHNGQDARSTHIIRTAHVIHVAHVTHGAHDYLNRSI